MTKQAEIDYFGKMTEAGRRFAAGKPFTAEERGAYLLDMGQILSLIPKPPARLLDLGCGSGWTTAMFARSGYDALGVDIAPGAIALAREAFGHTGARFDVQDFEALPFRSEFDIVVIYDCLHHAENERAVLESVFRALKNGGEAVIVEPGEGHAADAVSQRAVQAHGVTEKDMPARRTAKLLRAAGFRTVRVLPRAQFQVAEREGTGGIVRLLRPLLGARLAGLLKTLKNTAFPGCNGIVLARKGGGVPPRQ